MNAQKILPLAIAAAFLALPRAHAEIASAPVSKANLPTVAAAKATGNVNATALAAATLDKQAAKIDALAKGHADAKVVARLATDFVPMAGTPERAQTLVRGLHTGAVIRLNADADAVIGARARLGWGHTVVSLALARELLARHGIRNPSVADLRVALLGGDLRLIDGSLIPVRGILHLRGLGIGWQRIAEMLGVDPATLLQAVRTAENRVSDSSMRQVSETSSSSSSSGNSSSSSDSGGGTSSSSSSGGNGSTGTSNSSGGGGTTNASSGSGNSSNGSQSSLVRANDQVLDRQAALLDELAKSDATTVVTQLAREISSLTGSEDSARTLLQGLGDGSDSLIRTAGGDGASPARPRGGKLGIGGAFLVLAFARDLLLQAGIAQPDALQLRVALLGGTLERVGGGKLLVNGILRLRLHGATFGEIAQLNGIRLGRVMVAVRGATTVLAGVDHGRGVTRAAINVATRESARASADLLERGQVNGAGAADALVAQRLGLTSTAAGAIPSGTTVAAVGGVTGNATATIGSTVNGAAGVAGPTVTGTLGTATGTLNSTTGVVGGATATVGSLVPGANGALSLPGPALRGK